MIIVDQHAAHERIGYEKIKKIIERDGLIKQKILIQEIIKLPDETRTNLLYNAKNNLTKLGLTIEKFNNLSIIVSEIPSLLAGINVHQLIQDLADNLSDIGENVSLIQLIEYVTKTYASNCFNCLPLIFNFSCNSNLIIITIAIISAIGLIFSQFMPKSGNSNSKIKINFNLLYETIELLKYSQTKKQIYLSILGISWFSFISAAMMAQIPALAKETFGADENVATLFLVTFFLGVGSGSVLCHKIFQNEITTKYVFLAAIGISIFGMPNSIIKIPRY